jgi:hypothetical protein
LRVIGVVSALVVVPLLDKMAPLVMAAIDQTLRACGGVPTYALINNENGAIGLVKNYCSIIRNRFAVPSDGDSIRSCKPRLCTHRRKARSMNAKSNKWIAKSKKWIAKSNEWMLRAGGLAAAVIVVALTTQPPPTGCAG